MKNIFILLLFIPLFSIAQNIEKLEKKAEKHFYNEELGEALTVYREILKINSKNNTAKYRIEICSLLTNYRTKPIDRMLSYAKTQGKKDKFYNYWMGRIHLSQNHFKKAIKSWNSFLLQNKFRSKEITAEVEGLLKRAENLEIQFTHPENYEIEHVNSIINSKYSEYSPVYFKAKEELLFLSSNPDGGGNEKDGMFHVYHSKREGEGWSTPEIISKFGHFQASNANIEVVANDGRLFLYKEEGKGGLYYSELDDKTWTDLNPFDSKLTGKVMDSHFFINEREDRILFGAPKKKGAFDNYDIFESKKDPNSGKWSSPKILSENINSNLSEDYPYLTADDKTLYFSSKGHGSIGGYDVFKSVYNELTDTWSKPISLNYPTNTQNDDMQFKIDQATNSGYLVSDRLESDGDYDIFFFHEFDKIYYEGKVTDGSGKAVDHGILVFTPTRGTNLEAKISTNELGYYRVKLGINDEYKLAISFHDEVIYNEVFETPSNTTVSIVKNFKLVETKKAKEVIEYEHESPAFIEIEDLGNKFRHSNRAVLNNIYFKFGEIQLSTEAKKSLAILLDEMKKKAPLNIEIGGHTDNRGANDVNLNISILRANSVRDYLISKGIKSNRMKAVGYGDTKPIASNDDEENGRELNRRIEVLAID